MIVWSTWWVWLSAALVLGILEVIIPGFILLGFACGAAVVGVLLVIGGPLAAALTGSWPMTLLVFALASLVSWLVLRRLFGVYHTQVKLWNKDINDD